MKRFWFALVVCCGGVTWCAAQETSVTEATANSTDESPTWLPGKFVWADLYTTDPAGARMFYTGLFGWTAGEENDGRYVVLRREGEPIAGIARHPTRKPGAKRARWVLYASATDLPNTVARATAAGARVLVPARPYAGRGVQAVLADPQGAVVGVLHRDRGDPPDFAAEVGEWNWASLLARDPAAAKEFYADVFGYDIVPDERTERTNDYVLASEGYARGSLQPLPDRPDARPLWVGFVRVADVETAVARANELGGRTLLAPKEPRAGLRIAIVADPTGGTIGLVQVATWEPDDDEEPAP